VNPPDLEIGSRSLKVRAHGCWPAAISEIVTASELENVSRWSVWRCVFAYLCNESLSGLPLQHIAHGALIASCHRC
jgi:hypothetical protein